MTGEAIELLLAVAVEFCREATLRRVIGEGRRQGVKVILVEPQFSWSSAEQVAREIGGRMVVIDPFAEDYLGNMRKVAAAFAEGLEAK